MPPMVVVFHDETPRVSSSRSWIIALARFTAHGADPVKLHRQVAKYGTSVHGMPPLDVKRGSDGELVIHDGVTRQGQRQG